MACRARARARQARPVRGALRCSRQPNPAHAGRRARAHQHAHEEAEEDDDVLAHAHDLLACARPAPRPLARAVRGKPDANGISAPMDGPGAARRRGPRTSGVRVDVGAVHVVREKRGHGHQLGGARGRHGREQHDDHQDGAAAAEQVERRRRRDQACRGARRQRRAPRRAACRSHTRAQRHRWRPHGEQGVALSTKRPSSTRQARGHSGLPGAHPSWTPRWRWAGPARARTAPASWPAGGARGGERTQGQVQRRWAALARGAAAGWRAHQRERNRKPAEPAQQVAHVRGARLGGDGALPVGLVVEDGACRGRRPRSRPRACMRAEPLNRHLGAVPAPRRPCAHAPSPPGRAPKLPMMLMMPKMKPPMEKKVR